MTDSKLRSLIVPLDGSTLAEEAIAAAAILAKPAGAKVHLVMVEPPISVMAASQPGSEAHALSADQLKQRLQEYLTVTAETLSTTQGVHTQSELLRGLPPKTLATYAADHHIDLIVMTTHGRGGVSRFWLGSVADQLLRCVATPVLLLRPGSAALAHFRSMLLALDGSPASTSVLGPSRALGLLAGSRVTLLQVVETGSSRLSALRKRRPPVAPEQTGLERQAAVARLEQLAQEIRKRGLMVDVKVVTGDDVAEQVLAVAQTQLSDVIVVGTHGAGGMTRVLLGSVADKVVRGSTRPVLVVPSKTAE